jgi:WD40 repeat protein
VNAELQVFMSNYSAADILGFAKSKLTPTKPKEKKLAKVWEANIDDHVISLAYSPDGKYVLAAGIGGRIFAFDAAAGAQHFELEAHSFGVKMISWSRDGRYFTSAGQDGKIRLFDAGSFREIKTLLGGADWVECVRWSPHSDTFISTAGKKIRLWSAQAKLLQEYPEQPSTVVDVAWSPASEKFVTACYGGLTQWRAENTIPVHKYEWKGSTLVIHWSPNNKYIATGDQDSTVHFWITKNGKDLQMYGYPTKVMELSWDSTSRFLATGGGGYVTVWNCEPSPEGTKPMQLKGHENFLTFLAFQPNGLLLLSGDKDGKVSLWDVGDKGRFQTSVKLSGEITNISWSKDNRHFAVGDSDGNIKLYSVN